MDETPKRRWLLYFVRALLIVVTAFLAVTVAGVAVDIATTGHPFLGLHDDLPDEAKAIERWMNGLGLMFPLALLAAAASATYGVFRKTRQKCMRTLAVAAGLFLLSAASLVGNQVLLYHVFLPALGRARFEEDQAIETLTSLGEPAPDITVTTVDGNTINLADLRGRVVLVSFFATWCGACMLELPELQKIWDEFHAHDGFRMLVVGREETVESVRAFSGEHDFTFPLAADADRAAFDRFATDRIPRTYLISRDGRIIFQCVGYYEEQMGVLQTLLKAELAKSDTSRP
jgi:peroxiredoxin